MNKSWTIEAYNSYPNIRFTFKVSAPTLEEAKRIAARAIGDITICGCYT